MRKTTRLRAVWGQKKKKSLHVAMQREHEKQKPACFFDASPAFSLAVGVGDIRVCVVEREAQSAKSKFVCRKIVKHNVGK